MERQQQVTLIAVALVIAAVAVLVIGSGDDDDEETASTTTTQTQATSPEEPTGTVKAPTPKPEPEFQKVALAAGTVRGGEQEIEVEQGDTVRIEVTSDAPDSMHLHGYDVTKAVAPGKPARFRFKADLEGIFELEAHDLGHLTVATLVVEP